MSVRARVIVATSLAAAAWAAHPAARPDPARFYSAIRANDLGGVRTLAAEDANAKDDRGITPLMRAAAFGSLEAMRVLVEAGADVNAANEAGSTALMWSATDIAKVRFLVEHGADVNAASTRGRTALFLAALARAGVPPSEATDAVVANVAAQQLADGRWFLGGLKRPPIQDGDITRTAQAIRGLKDYAPPARAAEMNARIARAAAWLKSATPTTMQDRNMQMLGSRGPAPTRQP